MADPIVIRFAVGTALVATLLACCGSMEKGTARSSNSLREELEHVRGQIAVADRMVLTFGTNSRCSSAVYRADGESVVDFLDALELGGSMGGRAETRPQVEIDFYTHRTLVATIELVESHSLRHADWDSDMEFTPATAEKLATWFEDQHIPLTCLKLDLSDPDE